MTNEEKELLEAAAKAAGIKYKELHGTAGLWADTLKNDCYQFWNPITNLADRYELARKCRIDLDFEFNCVINEYNKFEFYDDYSEAIAILKAATATK